MKEIDWMNDLPLQRTSELLRGVIELLWSKPDGMAGNDIITSLSQLVKLTEYESGFAPSSLIPRYERTVRIATLPLVKVGWMIKTEKGFWYITKDGRDVCRRISQPQDLLIEALRLTENDRQVTSELHISLELIQERAWENFTRFIQGKSEIEIQELISLLFEAMQYHVIWKAPPQKKRGLIDMILGIDPVGAGARRILVMVRHTGQPITAEGLRSFNSILAPNDFGLIFSTGGFTSEVKGMLNKEDYQKINAMDLEKFFDVWTKHYGKLSLDAHTLLPLKMLFVLSPPR
jgi:restriction system protein